MRIIGGRDYYDHALAYGVDESIKFVRTGRLVRDHEFKVSCRGGVAKLKLPPDKNDPLGKIWGREHIHRWRYRGVHYEAEGVHVILCGRYYSGTRIYWYRGEYAPYLKKDWETTTFWDQNSLGKFLSGTGASFIPPEKRAPRQSSLWGMVSRDYTPFARTELSPNEKSWVIENGITVATRFDSETQEFPDSDRSRRDFVWHVNHDTLKYAEFIKVMDPVTAFQEISMWVGGVLPGQGSPMVQITDQKVKIEKHGFDAKTSFRHPVRIPAKKRKEKS